MYLETCLPSLESVYTIQSSFRAEKSHTRRHLSEFSHLEAEFAFIDFETLLNKIEDLVCNTVDTLLEQKVSQHLLAELNPDFVKLERPFMRMMYVDAIQWLNTNNVMQQDGTKFVVGDDINESAERYKKTTYFI